MKAKPIFIVKISFEIEKEYFNTIENNLNKRLSDYHVLIVPCNVDEPKFEVFYEKDFNEVKFEELKQIIKDSLNQ